MRIISTHSVLLFVLISMSMTYAFSQKTQVTGQLMDKENNQPLPFANIINTVTKRVVVTDHLGFFRISGQPTDTLKFTFVGYLSSQKTIEEVMRQPVILLVASSTELKEVEIRDSRSLVIEEFENIRPGRRIVKKDAIMELPALGGEPDFIKVITLLPGTTKGIEGTNDFFVRGGAADQNLILLDGATVYNTGHLFGFLSVFNPAAIGQITLLTGGFPAEYGGRLSSIIDIRSKTISKDQVFIEGGIGLISSRISAEIPLLKDKLAIQVAVRRTYADQVAKLADISLPYYFYDVNFNLEWDINKKSRLHYSYYQGDDALDYSRIRDQDVEGDESGSQFEIGNLTQTLSLRHNNESFTSTTDVHFTQFDYNINSFFQDNFIDVDSDIKDLGIQQKFTKPVNDVDKLHFGLSTIYKVVEPNLINSGGEFSEIIPASDGKDQQVIESAVFGEWEYERGPLEGIVGVRISSAKVPEKFYWQPEPRLAFRYKLDDNWALKASYTRMSQYIHRVSSSSFALPTDIWYPVEEQVKPQTANQLTLGVNKLFEKSGIVASSEVYYKKMTNLIEFREGTNLFLNNEFRESLIQGNGESYGIEWLARKDGGRHRGWLSYTLSWTNREFDKLNNGNPFSARYDRRHNVSLVTNYDLTDRWTFSAVWEFISGARFTPIIGYYSVPNAAATGIDLIPQYPERNSVKLADTHRLDFSIIFKGKKRPEKKWRADWHFSVYNAYNRATPIAIDIKYDEATDTYSYEQPGLLGLLPSISYNFKFIK